ncbi:MAG: iron ABC transporter permease [Nitrospiraceae bacterium]|nr:iron ABC transporter permease [Nitrospiraceae bacterium]MSR24810.1 iron ABC transporter permease [Nitrospiraceae bacterium]
MMRGAVVPVAAETGAGIVPAVLTATRWMTTVSALAVASVITVLVCLQFGAERIGVAEAATIVWRALQDGRLAAESAGSSAVILLEVRLPRLVLGFFVGGCLAAVGVTLQALLRNPLADPYVLGVSGGAAVGASLAIVTGLSAAGAVWLPLSAFAGSILSLVLLYRIAATYGYLSVHTLLLAGVIINALFSALIMFMTSLMDPTHAFRILSWMLGALAAPDDIALAVVASFLTFGGLLLGRQARALNLLTVGEDSARSLGVDVERVKRTLLITTALLTGAVVSVSGLIGFVGMAVPHAVRMLCGADNRLLMPACVFAGGMFLVIADTVARTALAPAELPVGVMTALVGAPFFLYLLMARKGGMAS